MEKAGPVRAGDRLTGRDHPALRVSEVTGLGGGGFYLGPLMPLLSPAVSWSPFPTSDETRLREVKPRERGHAVGTGSSGGGGLGLGAAANRAAHFTPPPSPFPSQALMPGNAEPLLFGGYPLCSLRPTHSGPGRMLCTPAPRPVATVLRL